MGSAGAALGHSIPVQGSVSQIAIRNREPVWIQDIEQASVHGWLDRYTIRSLLQIPLLGRSELAYTGRGVVSIGSTDVGTVTNSDLAAAQLLAHVIQLGFVNDIDRLAVSIRARRAFREIRKSLNIGVRTVAARMGHSAQAVAAWETRKGDLSQERAIAWCKALDLYAEEGIPLVRVVNHVTPELVIGGYSKGVPFDVMRTFTYPEWVLSTDAPWLAIGQSCRHDLLDSIGSGLHRRVVVRRERGIRYTVYGQRRGDGVDQYRSVLRNNSAAVLPDGRLVQYVD